MAFQVVGLEIGLTEIKLVQIIKKINSIEIAQFRRYQISSDEDFPSIIKQILSKYRNRGDLFVVGISSRKAIFRNLSLPFKNINKINKVMKYEVEPYLPYPLEEVIFTSQVNDDKEGENSDLFIGAVQKETINFYRQCLNAAGIDPQYIMLDCIALYNLYLHSTSADSKQIITLIDINEERTLLVVVQGEYLLFSRTILNPLKFDLYNYDQVAVQGKDFAESGNKAKDSKNSSSDDWDRLLGSFKKPIDLLLGKIDFTLYAFSSQQINVSISKIYLTGQITKLKKISEYFTQKLEIETSLFDPIEALGKVDGGNVSFKKQASLWSVPLGLAMEVKKDKKNRFNLRQEEFVYQKKYSQFKGMAFSLLVLFGVAISLLGVNIYYQTNIQQKKLDRINTRIQQVYSKVFLGASENHNELQQTKKALKVEKEKYRAYKVFSQKSLTHLQILKDLSSQIPKEIEVEFVNVSIDRNQIKIKGIADSFESVDRLKNSLQKIKKYAQIVVESAKVKGAESKVDFRLSITASDV